METLNSLTLNDTTYDSFVDQTAREMAAAAVSQEQLGDAVDQALAEAKESGDFDGAPGEDGRTPVKGVDYFTEEDKAELVAAASDMVDTSGFVANNQGAANVGKILAVGTDGNLVLVDMPEGGASGDVIGTLDESNNILLTGNLADGTYTLKYENADGTFTEIGTLEVGVIKPLYTNLAEPNTTNTTDWSIWCNDARFGSDGGYRQKTGTVVSNYIPYDTSTGLHQLRIKGMTSVKIAMYKSDKSYAAYSASDNTNGTFHTVDGDFTQWSTAYVNVKFVRVEGVLSGSANDVIITVDEEIV